MNSIIGRFLLKSAPGGNIIASVQALSSLKIFQPCNKTENMINELYYQMQLVENFKERYELENKIEKLILRLYEMTEQEIKYLEELYISN